MCTVHPPECRMTEVLEKFNQKRKKIKKKERNLIKGWNAVGQLKFSYILLV